MKIRSIWLFTLLMLMAYGHAVIASDIPQSASMIPYTKSKAILILDKFSKGLRSQGLEQVDFAPEDVSLIDEAESHPLYQFQKGHQHYALDSCTGLIRFYRDDLDLQLTKEEIRIQEVKWSNEAKVKKIADAVRNILLPDAVVEEFTLSNRMGSIRKTEHGIKVNRFLNANKSVLLYRSRQGNVRGPAFLRLEVERKSGLISSIIYENVKCDLRKSDVDFVMDLTKGRIENPVTLAFMDRWGLCWPVMTTGTNEKIKFLNLIDKKIYPIADITYSSQHESDRGCSVTHNGEAIIPGDNLLFKPIVVNGSPMIYSAYFPHFEIDTNVKKEIVILQGKLPKTGRKVQLTIASKQALIDEKLVTLSNPPTMVDGRLYLPYELLNLCNGVLVRWVPKQNMLLVDTRYLRR